MSSHAIILAAGKGTRMLPLTQHIPKPLIEVQGKPLIDWCIDWLQQGGVTDIVVNTAYLAEKLHDYLADHAGVAVSYEGAEPLETGGGIALALDKLGAAPFIAMNSDAIFLGASTLHHPLHALHEAWDESAMDFLMLLVPCANALAWEGKGDFMREADGTVRRPRAGEVAEYIFTGVEMIHPRVFNNLPEGAFSLSELWKRSCDDHGVYGRVKSVVLDGQWLNVGDIEALEVAKNVLNQAA